MKSLRFILISSILCLVAAGCSACQKTPEARMQEIWGFFFPNVDTAYSYKLTTSFDSLSDMNQIQLMITEIKKYDEGVLYELKCDINEDIVDRYGIPVRDLGLFFVQDDKIYFIRDGAVKDELVNVETITDKGTLVCCEEGRADALSEEERGWHEYILADGNRREYHGYNTLVETGYYETFIWEEGKGLTGYRRGYGAEADALELHLN